MLIARTNFYIVFCCTMLLCCRNDEKEQQLARREKAVVQKEKEFAMKEADYASLVRMRDSLLSHQKDTIIIQRWPETIAGLWNAKSVCRESNCSDYVIGDQRANLWEFLSDSTGLLTRVTDKNNNLVRVYNARLDSAGINLRFMSDSSASKHITLNIDLSAVSAELMKGTQTTNVDQSCTAKFAVELTRSTNR